MADEPTESRKKVRRLDSSGGRGGDLKRVSEIVMVLSAMGKMRGGRCPSAPEMGLMAEAREKLAVLCESCAVPPKDLVSREAVRVLVDDLGLGGSKDLMRFGFRAPRMSIGEKFSFVKRKMEESNELAARSAAHSPHPVPLSSAASSGRNGASFHAGATNTSLQDKTSTMPLSAGGFQPPSPVVFVPALAPASSLNQSQVVEMAPTFVLMPYFGSPAQSDPSSSQMPRTEAVQFRVDAQTAYLSQAQGATYFPFEERLLFLEFVPYTTVPGSQAVENAPSSMAVPQAGHAVKVPDHTPLTDEVFHEVSAFQSAPQAVRDHNSTTSVVHSTPGSLSTMQQPCQVISFEQPHSLYTNYSEIARSVQKIIQSKYRENPNWMTPSTDYMSSPLPCQMCKVSIQDVDSLLVCDACENGVHLKCLQSCNQKGITPNDWHCPRCLLASRGKPLPKKYGPVCRSVSGAKVSPNKTGTQATAEKRTESPDQKINHQKLVSNVNPAMVNPNDVGTRVNNDTDHAPNGKMLTGDEKGADSDSRPKISNQPHYETCADAPMKEGVVCGVGGASGIAQDQNGESSLLQLEKSISASGSVSTEAERPFSNQTSHPAVATTRQCQTSRSSEGVKTRSRTSAEASENQIHETAKHALEDFQPNPGDVSKCNPGGNVELQDKLVDVAVSNGTSDDGNISRNCTVSLLGSLCTVYWVGDVLRISGQKVYYSSCCVNGTLYKLQDYSLLCPSNKRITPSKLQALWEDKETGSKWATVNHCYFPDDLPKSVGRPCSPEDSEVNYLELEASSIGRFISEVSQLEIVNCYSWEDRNQRLNQLIDIAIVGQSSF
ncbi:hypothetical protein ACLOJK_000695 [Asimina triloba]